MKLVPLVVVAVASLVPVVPVAHADEPAEPRVAATVLTVQKGGAKPARLLVQRTTVEHARPAQPCPVHVTLATQHAEFRSIELDFTYVATPSRNGKLPLQLSATTSRHGDALAKGTVAVTVKKPRSIVGKLDARIDHAGTRWQLRGTIEIANVTCVDGAR